MNKLDYFILYPKVIGLLKAIFVLESILHLFFYIKIIEAFSYVIELIQFLIYQFLTYTLNCILLAHNQKVIFIFLR